MRNSSNAHQLHAIAPVIPVSRPIPTRRPLGHADPRGRPSLAGPHVLNAPGGPKASLRTGDPHGLRPTRGSGGASIVPINAARRARAEGLRGPTRRFDRLRSLLRAAVDPGRSRTWSVTRS